MFRATFIVLVFQAIYNCVMGEQTYQPGLRLSLKESAVKELENYLLPIILSNISQIPVKDQILKQHIDFIGNVELSLTGMKIQIDPIVKDLITVEFLDNSTLNTSISQFKAHLVFDYDFKTNFLNSKGNGTANLNDLSLTMLNRLFMLPSKATPKAFGPGIEVLTCYFDHFNLEMKFSQTTPLEKLIVYLVDNLNYVLQKPVFESLSGYIIPTLNSGFNTTLEKIPLRYNITQNVGLDISLSEAPRTFNNSLELSFNGRNSSNVIPHSDADSSKFVAYFNQDLFQNIFDLLHNNGLIKLNVYSEMIPKTSPVQFDTKAFGVMIPKIPEIYGDDKKMDMLCSSTSSPALYLENNKTGAKLDLECKFNVRLSNKTNDTDTAFVADIELDTSLTASMRNNSIVGWVKTIEFVTLTVKDSKVGPINTEILKTGLNFVLDFGIRNIINSYLDKGITVPTFAGISLKDSVAESHKGYAQIDINLIYTNQTSYSVQRLPRPSKFLKYMSGDF